MENIPAGFGSDGSALCGGQLNLLRRSIWRRCPELVKAMSQNYINGTVTVERFDWNGRLEFTAYGLEVSGTDGERIAEIPEARFAVSPLQALAAPARALSDIELVRPQLYLKMNAKDEWNLRNFLKPSDSSETPFLRLSCH